MSKFPGGIFSKARGKTSGIVFSAARTRKGKLMTSRQLVIPTNPQTPSQQTNRFMFQFIQIGVRLFGPSVYRSIFNRGVEDLPGYQSLLSLFRRLYSQSSPGVWSATNSNPDTLLGDLHFPESVSNITFTGEDLSVDFSTELGENGSNDDRIYLLAMDYQVDTADDQTWGHAVGWVNRSAGTITVSRVCPGGGGWELGSAFCLVAFNSLNAEGLQRSIAKWYSEVE